MPNDRIFASSAPIDPDADARKAAKKVTKMQYILTGFTHDVGFRVFAFERIGEDRVRTAFSVRADLALSRKYGIRMQELPLLCQAILEERDGDNTERSFTYTEAAMCLRATNRAAEVAAQKRKAPRKPPPSENDGAAWRGPRL